MKLLALTLLLPSLAPQDPPPKQAQPPGPMLLPQAVILPRGKSEITIDGTLTDWPELPALRLDDPRQLSGTGPGAWNGPKDLSAMVFLMWDEEHLYVSAKVRDEWHRALDANTLQLSEVPVADSLVFTFDPDRNTRSAGADPGRAEDREFWIADENGHEVVQWDRLRGTAHVLSGDVARMVVLHDKETSVTSYEARIPWSEILPLGRKPAAGLVFDMQIVVNDYDESTDPMPQTRIGWTFGCAPIVDPGLFGSAMLVADAEALRGKVPDFPPKPSVKEPPLPPESHWRDLTARLLQRSPAVHDGSAAPEEAGGTQRMKVLEEIDTQCEIFPRVDYVEFLQRIHRRMNREVAGYQARGLPWWWRDRLQSVSKTAEDPVPNGTARLYRLPMGGWMVGLPVGGFGVDVAGADVAQTLWGRSEFCLLTQPLDMTRRNDQFLMRLMLNKPPRAVLTHIAFHLPVVQMTDMPLVTPGTEFGPPAGAQIRALADVRKDGSVPYSCSYRVAIPNGPTLLFVGPTLRPEDLLAEKVDAMILSPRNPLAPAIVAKVLPGLVVLDDSFLCQSRPGMPRVTLRSLYQLQKVLQPQRSLLLAPGETWDVVRTNR